MKHIIQKIFSFVKKLFFLFRVIVTLEIGMSDGEEKHNDASEDANNNKGGN